MKEEIGQQCNKEHVSPLGHITGQHYNMLPSTIFKPSLKELKDCVKIIPLTEQVQHILEHKISPHAASNLLP